MSLTIYTFTFEMFEKNPHLWNCATNFFGKFLEKLKNSFPVTRSAFPIQFLRFADRRNTQEHHALKKVSSVCSGE